VANEGEFVTRFLYPDKLEEPANPARKRRIRVIAVLGGLALAVAAALLLPRLSLGADEARRMLVEEVGRTTGGTARLDGPVSFTLLPRTRITADRLRVDGAGMLRVERVVADLDPVDALFGRASISRLVLIRPEYAAASAAAEPATADPAAADPAAPVPAAVPASGPRAVAEQLLARLPQARVLDVRQGVYRGGKADGSADLRNANIVISRGPAGDATDVSGTFVWNGDTTSFRLALGSRDALISGASSSVDFEMSSPTLVASFDGSASLSRISGMTGRIRLESPSLSRSIEWLANPAARVPDIGPLAVAGDLVFAGVDANLQGVDVRMGGSRGQGALEANFGGDVPTIGGTLAFERLDLAPLFDSIAPLPHDPFDLSRPIDVDFSREIRLDLRLSAERASLGPAIIEDVAAALLAGDGTAKVDIGDATLFGGRGQASLAIDARQVPPQAIGHLTLSSVDTAALFAALQVRSVGVSGTSQISAEMTTPVVDWARIMRNAQFDASVKTNSGVLTGFDPDVFRRPGARALEEGASGATVPFNDLEARLNSFGPRIHLQELRLTSSTGTVAASGVISALTREMRIRGTFDSASPMTASADHEFTTSQPVAFTMGGHWPNPDVTSQ
jgi:hypothetical protein